MTDVERVAARFLRASLANELTRKMNSLLAGPLEVPAGIAIARWFDSNFNFGSSKTPKGQKQLKEDVEKLHWWLLHGIEQNGERARATIEHAWKAVRSRLPDLVRYFSEEGGVITPKQAELNGNLYINKSGFQQHQFERYVKRVEMAIDALKGWRRKALAGGVKVVLAGPKDFRGTASGTYKSSEDALYVRATPNILKRQGTQYAGFEYILWHELGHRYERKLGLNGMDFDTPQWWTSRYSKNEGESFAELFAISNDAVSGPWDSEVVERFDALMASS